MKDKEAWAIIGQFLVDFRQIAGMCWEGLEIPSSPEKEDAEKWEHWRKAERIKASLRKILDYIGEVTKKRPKLLWVGEWDPLGADTINIYNVIDEPHRAEGAYVIVIDKEQEQ